MAVWITDTSRGKVALHFEFMSKSTGTAATLYRVADDGWAVKVGHWNRHLAGGDDLSAYLQRTLELPAEEAQALGQRGLALWLERHGDRSDMSRADWIRSGSILTGAFGLIFLAILAATAGAVWLLIELI